MWICCLISVLLGSHWTFLTLGLAVSLNLNNIVAIASSSISSLLFKAILRCIGPQGLDITFAFVSLFSWHILITIPFCCYIFRVPFQPLSAQSAFLFFMFMFSHIKQIWVAVLMLFSLNLAMSGFVSSYGLLMVWTIISSSSKPDWETWNSDSKPLSPKLILFVCVWIYMHIYVTYGCNICM